MTTTELATIEQPIKPVAAKRSHKPAPKLAPAIFTIDGEAFAATVKLVAKAAGRLAPAKNHAPATITLAFRDQRVIIGATDYETTVATRLPVRGKRGIQVAVEARKLVEFTKALGDDTVTITVNPEAVTLVSGEVTFSLPPMESAAAITLPAVGETAPLDFAAFARVVGITAVAASTDDARPILAAICIKGGIAAATDSYKLAVAEGAPPIDALIPAKPARLAVALFDGTDEVTYEITPNRQLVLRSATTSFAVRLVDGDYPTITSLIRNPNHDVRLTVSREQMIEALAKVNLASENGASPTRMTFASGTLLLACAPQDGPTADAEIAAAASGDIPVVAINSTYLLALLRAVPSDNVQLSFVDTLKPILITDADGSGQWMLLIMPVRAPA